VAAKFAYCLLNSASPLIKSCVKQRANYSVIDQQCSTTALRFAGTPLASLRQRLKFMRTNINQEV